MGQGGEETREDTGEGRGQRQHRMGCRPCYKCAALVGVEATRHVASRAQAGQSQTGRCHGMGRRRPHGAEEGGQGLVQVAHQRREDAAVGRTVPAQRAGDVADIGPYAHGASAIERMGERDVGRQQPDAVMRKIEVAEGRRGEQEWVDRGADVVPEAVDGQLGRPAATSGLVRRLVDVDGQTGASQQHGGHQAVRPGAHDDGVGLPHRQLTERASAPLRPR